MRLHDGLELRRMIEGVAAPAQSSVESASAVRPDPASPAAVIAFMMSREATQRTYNNIGVPDPHHGLSHHADDPVKLEKVAKIDEYLVSVFAYYLNTMKSTPDGQGGTTDDFQIDVVAQGQPLCWYAPMSMRSFAVRRAASTLRRVVARRRCSAVVILPVTPKVTAAPDASGARVQGVAAQAPCRATSDRLSGAIRATMFLGTMAAAWGLAKVVITIVFAARSVCAAPMADVMWS